MFDAKIMAETSRIDGTVIVVVVGWLRRCNDYYSNDIALALMTCTQCAVHGVLAVQVAGSHCCHTTSGAIS
jgi:hypothetical protein